MCGSEQLFIVGVASGLIYYVGKFLCSGFLLLINGFNGRDDDRRVCRAQPNSLVASDNFYLIDGARLAVFVEPFFGALFSQLCVIDGVG